MTDEKRAAPIVMGVDFGAEPSRSVSYYLDRDRMLINPTPEQLAAMQALVRYITDDLDAMLDAFTGMPVPPLRRPAPWQPKVARHPLIELDKQLQEDSDAADHS